MREAALAPEAIEPGGTPPRDGPSCRAPCRRRHRRLGSGPGRAAVRAVLLLLVVLGTRPALLWASEGQADQSVWVDLERPAPGTRISGDNGWIEIEGWAGAGGAVEHDVVLLLDVSGSTAYASGVDVDGDGKLGRRRKRIDPQRSFNPRHYSSDPGDTVLAAELAATRRLLDRLDLERTRVAIVVFSSGAHVVAALGSDREALDAALRELERGFGSGATNLAGATRRACETLRSPSAAGNGRERSIVILSDGYPTFPGSEKLAASEARQAALESAAQGVRIFAYSLGLEEIEADDVFAEMAERTGGQYVHLGVPGDIIHELPRVDLSSVQEIEIANVTTGEAARAPRLFPDGTFDAFLNLAPGDNRIRVEARGDAGASGSVERSVFLDLRQPANAEEAREFAERNARLREELELRGREAALALEAARAREQRRKQLELRPEAGAPDAE
jgi:hypothetical protein